MLQTSSACLQMLEADPTREAKEGREESVMLSAAAMFTPPAPNPSDSSSSAVNRALVAPGEQATLASTVKEDTSQKPPISDVWFQVPQLGCRCRMAIKPHVPHTSTWWNIKLGSAAPRLLEVGDRLHGDRALEKTE